MGFIEKYDPYSDRSQYEFFTPKECTRISKILLRDEPMVLDIPNTDNNSYEGLTHQFPVYNWLNNPDILQFDIPKRLFTLPEFRQEKVLYVQCWANILRQGQNIPYHQHGNPNTNDGVEFYASNTFISGPETTGTYYNDAYERNSQGIMHLIGSYVTHGVHTHMSHTPRISMAMDIYHSQSKVIKNAERYHTDTQRFKRIENRFNSK